VRINRTLLRKALATGLTLAALAPAADARSFTVIHSFSGGADGANPTTDVQFDNLGDLYGTTTQGGASNAGTVYKIAPDGTETVLHSFEGGAKGASPWGGVTIDARTGDLYGTTWGDDIYYDGTSILYRLQRDGTFNVLHVFDDVNDGYGPIGTLIRCPGGTYCGVAQSGAVGGECGTIFKYGGGKFAVLHTFDPYTPPDGCYPSGRLIEDRAGNLYGVTEYGGANNNGTIYRLAFDGTFTVLYSFTGGDDGLNPVGGLARDRDGNLYGTTQGPQYPACGTVFVLSPNGALTTLHSFAGVPDGCVPKGDVVKIGNHLYVTTIAGGGANNGAVIKLSLDGTETILHSFAGVADGGEPWAALTEHTMGGKRLLYSTTYDGGQSCGYCGVVFSTKP
jgi:uncharacterized repeat protein (TIGR03803 family)